jgi:hypothetical protein
MMAGNGAVHGNPLFLVGEYLIAPVSQSQSVDVSQESRAVHVYEYAVVVGLGFQISDWGVFNVSVVMAELS